MLRDTVTGQITQYKFKTCMMSGTLSRMSRSKNTPTLGVTSSEASAHNTSYKSIKLFLGLITPCPIGSMGLVYSPTFTIKINQM